jgi:hypothetical protein
MISKAKAAIEATYFPLHHSGIIARQKLVAIVANVMLLMPVLTQRKQRSSDHRLLALAADLRKQLCVVQVAVGLALVLEEVAVRERLVAVGAHKVLGVPHATHRCERPTRDRLAATEAYVLQRHA